MAGQKCALIVDDSKSARHVLRKLLTAHQLRVETAESAEDALAYLSTARPDVIFMDHMMPGMDGFQAVRAIKDNPATATIPIMMYTSQEGELYVGQARALGAVGTAQQPTFYNPAANYLGLGLGAAALGNMAFAPAGGGGFLSGLLS